MRHTHHRYFRHGGMSVKCQLNFVGRNIFAASNDDVAQTVVQFDVTVRVDHGQVAAVKPAAPEILGRGFRLFVVALHHDGAAHDHFPDGLTIGPDIAQILVHDAHGVAHDE